MALQDREPAGMGHKSPVLILQVTVNSRQGAVNRLQPGAGHPRKSPDPDGGGNECGKKLKHVRSPENS